jgi:hypothetical protein
MNGDTITLAAVAALALAGFARKRMGSRYRAETDLFTVQSETGKTYNLRVVPPGGSYGRDHALTNTSSVAMLEFYWPNDKIGVQPWGNFTGERYNLTTLVKGGPKGLALQNDRDGRFSAKTMNRAIVWALGGNPDSMWG